MSRSKTDPAIIRLLCVFIIVLSLGGLGNDALTDICASQTSFLKSEIKNPQNSLSPSDSETNTADSSLSSIDFNALKAINPDTVGWLKIDGTGIDTPVVQTSNNEKYLSVTFEGNDVPLWGTVFLDCAYHPNRIPKAQNSVLYGHSNIGRPSLFGELLNYKDPSFYNTHRRIAYSRPGDPNVQWQVIAVFHMESDSDYRRPDFYSTADYLSYFKNLQALSFYPADTEIVPGGEMLTLSTCDFNIEGFSDPRLVILAQRIP